MKMDIVIIGVGGQGTLLTSRILGALAQDQGFDVKVSEVHGMSQRGGSVITYVRIGDGVASPMVDLGSADYVLAFEQLEAMRALPYLKKGGTIIVNTQKIEPIPVIMGAAEYPEDILETLEKTCNVIKLDALKLARDAGSAKAVNLVLLGVLKKLLNGEDELWLKAVESCVKPEFYEINRRALQLGEQC